MMSSYHGGGWQPPQTDSHIHIDYILSVKAHWYDVHCHIVAALHSYTCPMWYMAQTLGYWVTCGVKMMSLCHCCGWQPPQSASHIQIRHIKSVWAHWYAVYRHMVVAIHIFTHPTWLRFVGSRSLVESKWCHYVIVEADSHLKLSPASILDIQKVFEHIDHRHMVAALHSHTHSNRLKFWGMGHLWSQNDVIMSWLRLTATLNCLPQPF